MHISTVSCGTLQAIIGIHSSLVLVWSCSFGQLNSFETLRGFPPKVTSSDYACARFGPDGVPVPII